MLALFFFLIGIVIYNLRYLIPLTDIDGPEELLVKGGSRLVIWAVGLFLMLYACYLWGWRIIHL